jgi:striatin 1/3/4
MQHQQQQQHQGGGAQGQGQGGQQQGNGASSADAQSQAASGGAGQEMNLASVLHYLQSEWRRWERDRNEWEIERAEMRVRLVSLPPWRNYLLGKAICQSSSSPLRVFMSA